MPRGMGQVTGKAGEVSKAKAGKTGYVDMGNKKTRRLCIRVNRKYSHTTIVTSIVTEGLDSPATE